MGGTQFITLDYTLRDLYSDNNDDDDQPVLVYYPLQFGYNHESSTVKFTYGYTLQDDTEKASSSNAMAANMVPQRYAFSAGQMPLVILDFHSKHHSDTSKQTTGHLPHRVDIRRTFNQLRPDQQPALTFATSPENISSDAETKIAVLLPTDCLSHLTHLVDPEIHYEILSKRGLALSGLPTPSTQVIDAHLINQTDPAVLKTEVLRMVESIDHCRLPFVIKLPQSISGIGTFPVTTETERSRVKETLTTNLGSMLQQLNPCNHHLYPCSILLQDFIAGPVVALSLFVTRKGQPRFVACCQQLFDKQGHWIGGSVAYKQQTELHKKYATIMEKVAAFLNRKGYHGPAGVDIVTDERSGEQLVIDLNVRVTGTFHLGPLKGHFTQRGLFEAAMTTGDISCSRDAFEERFEEEIRSGSMILSGWVHGELNQFNHAAITIAAKDSGELEEYFGRLRAAGLRT
ncbi:hypothetical protein N7492_005847 [Penicillium capsulatum]|uniref:ATP-grasp domain-containing protein n=1 Tax=Penicillium capsulatum TaxID=69766 RepID=A0A9W9IC69_9EURO|nr:hypothetical protein N7492_005847 [Penicillium capsulatum]KAJ6135053.1 hypothetical protein N7512_000213 [Penicillium capsulatum]